MSADRLPHRLAKWLEWLPIGRGWLALWHRPRLRSLPALGCDRVVTALSEREGAMEIGEAVERAGMAWSWIPLASGRPPSGRPSREAYRKLLDVSRHLQAGESVLLHCSAGMHRTGMLALALLLERGLSYERAMVWIEKMRRHTAEAITPEHRAWAHQYMLFAAALAEADLSEDAAGSAAEPDDPAPGDGE